MSLIFCLVQQIFKIAPMFGSELTKFVVHWNPHIQVSSKSRADLIKYFIFNIPGQLNSEAVFIDRLKPAFILECQNNGIPLTLIGTKLQKTATRAGCCINFKPKHEYFYF